MFWSKSFWFWFLSLQFSHHPDTIPSQLHLFSSPTVFLSQSPLSTASMYMSVRISMGLGSPSGAHPWRKLTMFIPVTIYQQFLSQRCNFITISSLHAWILVGLIFLYLRTVTTTVSAFEHWTYWSWKHNFCVIIYHCGSYSLFQFFFFYVSASWEKGYNVEVPWRTEHSQSLNYLRVD